MAVMSTPRPNTTTPTRISSSPSRDGIDSPSRHGVDSPSRQLLHELNQLAISSQEDFYAQLDRDNEERSSLHKKALTAAAQKHEEVIQGVENERQRLEAHVAAERRRREAEARRKLEKEARQREIEEKERQLERERARLAELRRLEELEEERRSVQRDEESRSREQELRAREQEERRREEAQTRADKERNALAVENEKKASNSASFGGSPSPKRAENAVPISTSTAVPQPPLPNGSVITTAHPDFESEHNIYLDIHKRLKDLRRFIMQKGKEDPDFKRNVGDMRREIQKCVGQLVDGKGANRQPLSNILSTLKRALQFPTPTTDVSQFIASPPSPLPDIQGPALLIYLLNIFSKAIISQYIDEAGVEPKAADPVGIIASHIFSHADFKWNSTSLIDILLAKYHAVCPVLFGVYGPENTDAGRQRLGWWRDEPGGPFVLQQRHYERMTGLGAGFAALSLRNYEKSKQINPFPDYNYWQALARIVNTPAQGLTQTHFVVLKGMIENYEGKFIAFYGGAAVAALRLALVDLPQRTVPGVASKSLAGLVDVLRKDKKLPL